ncbi:MAG: PD-(D/E)XK motif protein [Bacillota bacterium]|nr:PD-(D/E)XK motif protein [Bacillota bacterium]
MLTINELTIKWNALRELPGEPVYQGYDATHPLQFFIGLDSTGNREFFIIVSNKPTNVPACSRSIEVSSGLRRDGTHTLVFRLVQPDQQEVFTHLCWDLAEASRSCADKKKGLAVVLTRYALWQRLMEKGNMGLLSEQELKGVFGEIYFLKNRLLDKYGVNTAVAGWIGPTKVDRDFIYNDYWYEVKTTNPGAPSLKISSIEQLDTDEEGRIAWVQAEKTSSTDPAATSLPLLINETKMALEGFPEAMEIFIMRILESGVVDRKEYYDLYFACRNIRLFSVAEGFPRIRRKDIDTGIIAASYEVNISEISSYELLGED